MTGVLRIGTRGSALALWQARTVAARLEGAGVRSELVVIRTSGDQLQDAPLSETGGKRLFVKEIEDALLRGDVDAAVHSAKDMPAELPRDLSIAATLPREDPRDAIVLPDGSPAGTFEEVLAQLGSRPAIATSSVRRVAQLTVLVPGARFLPIRGNVDTRLRKLDSGECQALVLASAGLRRLGFGPRIATPVPVEHCIPAPGQGIVAVEIRADDATARAAMASLHDEAAGRALAAERALVAALGGGCQLPLGGLALLVDGLIDLHAVVMSIDGQRVVRSRIRARAADPAEVGRQAAGELAAAGAVEILEEVRNR
ncbi:MAG TPA: hydroxymethylbilane synthase [Vicinamibacterales bacterium]|nr:hydroxymethylbilane synthase [Vicinamibacterales bacterium]